MRAGDLRGLPATPGEGYVTRAELADLMHVSVATVDRMVSQGMPSESWGRRTRRFRASVALQWAREQENPRKRKAA